MAYSKLRGARKPKKKDENSVNIAEHDAFQEQGMKLIDKLLAHPYFILGSVAAIIGIVVIATLISSAVKSKSDKLAFDYASAVETFESESGESTEFDNDIQKYTKAISQFEKVMSEQSGSFNAAASMVYVGKAHQRMNNCEKAVEYFKKARSSGKLAEELLFGVYEGEAICHFDKKEFKKTAEIWKEWLNRKTDIYKDHALYYIGLSYEKSGKDDEALSYYKRLKDEHPDSLLIVKINDKVPAQIETAPKPAEN